MFNPMTQSYGEPEVPTVTQEHEAAVHIRLEDDNLPHAIAKIAHVQKKTAAAYGAWQAEIADAQAQGERGRNTLATVRQYERERELNRNQWDQENITNKIDKPKVQGERDVAASKKRIAAARPKPTLAVETLFAAIKPNRHYIEARVEPPTRNNPMQKLTETRGGIEATKQDYDTLKERSHYLLDDALANMESAVDWYARKGEVKASTCLARILDLSGRPMRPTLLPPTAFSHSGTVIFDGFAAMCWAFPDQIKAKLAVEIRERHKPHRAMSNTQRTAKLAELKAEILHLERIEESLIELCEAAGFDVQRRPDANPLAVLGIARAPDAAVIEPPDVADDDAPDANAEDFESADFG